MQLELGLSPARDAILHIASSPDAAWDGAIEAWFAHAGVAAWSSELPAVVVVPTRSHAQAFRARLLASGRSALGVHFVTPPYLRALLQGEQGNAIAAREHLRLLLAVAAEEQLSVATLPEPEQLAATSVRRTPDHLLRLLDQLAAAGWAPKDVDLPAFRSIIDRFRAQLRHCGFELFSDLDRAALDRAKAQSPQIANLLISGFHGAHWPIWHVLQAAVAAAKEATVLLQYPRDEAGELDTAWIGSWEENCGEAEPVETNATGAESSPECLFLVGIDAQEQAQAITAAAIQFLADERCLRLAIVCPAAGALSRLVAASLTRHGIPHLDALGQLLPGIFETASFARWIELQRTPRLNVLLEFLQSLAADHILFAKIAGHRIENALRNALSEIAIDDLTLLAAYCRERGAEGNLVYEVLQTVRLLPQRATLAEFLRATCASFESFGWDERWQEIELRSAWAHSSPAAFSSTLYLRWLGEIASTLRVTRDAVGSHPYARVQILTAAQAENQTWSHIIVAGLNEGSWLANGRGDFLPSEEIEAFNRSVQKLNRAATRRGGHGEGHVAVREGKTLFVGPQQQRQLALAQFSSLLESTQVGIALTASLIQEAAPERISNPSELFSRAYHERRGVPMSQARMRALREATSSWVGASHLLRRDTPAETPEVAQTRIAYASRRDDTSSGEYDFALRNPPRELKPLSVSNVEALLQSPALVWMKRFLGVEGAEDASYAWNSTVGKWTHAWLASIGGKTGGFVPMPDASAIKRNITAAAERKRAEVLRLCESARRPVPDWWQSGWENALCLAQALGDILASAEGWRWAVTEWTLPAKPIPIAADRTLLIHGRADLLLARTEIQPTTLDVPELLIIDFKTGNKKLPLLKRTDTPEQRRKRAMKLVLKREALQLALYAFAARESGASDVELGLVSPITPRVERQLTIEDLTDCEPIFAELARMQQTGIFGMRGALRGQFTFTGSYPLATLPVDRDLVDERWERTHPALVLDEEPFR